MNNEEKKFLLQAARESVKATVTNQQKPKKRHSLQDSDYGGAFVTLRNQGKLRGCMGTFSPTADVVETIINVAALSASDPRFRGMPITSVELDELDIEISILSPSEPTHDPLSLTLGVHGIVIDHPRGRGCFLPHVATELGWSTEEFLSHCCQDKAHLAPDAWKESSTKVLLFTAVVFSE